MATTYYNCPVKLGLASDTNPSYFFVAQSASVEESIPMLPIRSLGVSNSINAVPENTIQGSVNINFLLSFGNAGGLNSITPQNIIDWTCIDEVNPTLLKGSIGPIRFYDAVVSSFSVNADAQSVVNCSLSLNYYKHTEPMDSGGSISENDFDGAALSYAHGANSDPDATSVALNDNLFSFSSVSDAVADAVDASVLTACTASNSSSSTAVNPKSNLSKSMLMFIPLYSYIYAS